MRHLPPEDAPLLEEQLPVQEAGDANGQDVDDCPADDLIHLVRHRQDGVQQSQQSAGENSGHHADEQAGHRRHLQDRVEIDGSKPAEEGRREHHPFDTDVDHAGAFAVDTAQCSQGEWRGH